MVRTTTYICIHHNILKLNPNVDKSLKLINRTCGQLLTDVIADVLGWESEILSIKLKLPES